MKINRSVLVAFGLLILAASLYRVMPGRPFGFAPQWAMAVFAGAVIKDKRLSFLLPLVSMFISDSIYQLLYVNGLTQIPGFYEGQLLNYLLFGSMVFFGLLIRRISWIKIIAASLAAPSAFFILSNLMVWIGGGGYSRPQTFTGLLQCFADGIPFYQMSMISTLVFSTALFGSYLILKQKEEKQQIAM
jgi:hypothetical protein